MAGSDLPASSSLEGATVAVRGSEGALKNRSATDSQSGGGLILVGAVVMQTAAGGLKTSYQRSLILTSAPMVGKGFQGWEPACEEKKFPRLSMRFAVPKAMPFRRRAAC
jgi:hypothetical protein